MRTAREKYPFVTKAVILKKSFSTRFTNVFSNLNPSFNVKRLQDLLKRYSVSFMTRSIFVAGFICICKSFTFRRRINESQMSIKKPDFFGVNL